MVGQPVQQHMAHLAEVTLHPLWDVCCAWAQDQLTWTVLPSRSLGPEMPSPLLHQPLLFRALGPREGRGSMCIVGGWAGQRLCGHDLVALSLEHRGPPIPSLP